MRVFSPNSAACYLSAFASDLAARGLKPSTRAGTLSCVRDYLERLTVLGLDPLAAGAATLKDYHVWLEERPNRRRGGRLAPRTVRLHLRAVASFYAFLERGGHIEINPASRLRAPRASSPARTALTREEMDRLRAAASGAVDRALLAVFYGCGLRRAEGEQLNAGDVDVHGGLLHVRAGKGGRPRSVPMSDGVVRDLLPVLRLMRPHGRPALFVSRLGARMSGAVMYGRVKRMAARAQLTSVVTLHGLRHAVATHLLEAGLTLEQTRDFLGHRTIDTTRIYTHIQPAGPQP